MDSNDYCGVAVDLKRKGDLVGAIKAYCSAIDCLVLGNNVIMPFYGLAKVCYLNNNRSEAISYYLINIHVGLHGFKNGPDVEKARKHIIMNYDKEVVGKFSKIHSDAVLLFTEPETPRHLAHAYLDFNDKYQSFSHFGFSRQGVINYRNAISGKCDNTDDDIESSYSSIGLHLSSELVDWNLLDRPFELKKVVEHYLKQAY